MSSVNADATHLSDDEPAPMNPRRHFAWRVIRRSAPAGRFLVMIAAGLVLFHGAGRAGDGLDLSQSRVLPEQILPGGPPKDGIPAIDRPRFVPASEASFLEPGDRVVGVANRWGAKAYPLRILTWHEAVNDSLGREDLVVTYCPLTGSAVAYDREVDGQILSFGISGRLYQSNVLLYDRQSDSLWSQLREEAITGPHSGKTLRPIPAVVTSWEDWKEEHPGTLVLSPETVHRRNYAKNPYASYEASPRTMFPVEHHDDRLPSKAHVLGLELNGEAKAYALRALAGAAPIEDEVGGVPVRIEYERESRQARALRRDGEPEILPAVVLYWFAWVTFHPETELWAGDMKLPTPGKAARDGRPPGGTVEPDDGVVIEEHSAYWTELFGLGLTASDGRELADRPGVLVIRGKLRNTGAQPLRYVALRYEILDDEGVVVGSETGHNRLGESLRDVESPVALERDVEAPVARSIPAGGEDSFRMVFFRDEIPAFGSYRIRVRGRPETGEP